MGDAGQSSLRGFLQRIRLHKRGQYKRAVQTAMGYIEPKFSEHSMVDDCVAALHQRFRRAQSGEATQRIQPVCEPIAQRFIAEQATAYNRGVRRSLVDDDGEVALDETDALRRMLDAINFDEHMHALERRNVLLGGCGLWPQVTRSQDAIWPAVVLPSDIYPVHPAAGDGFNLADPDEYDGLVVDLGESGGVERRHRYALLTADEITVFDGHYSMDDAARVVSVEPNPYGMSMLTVWQERLYPHGLLPMAEPPVVSLNREVNVALSVLMDVIRWQSYGQPVLGLHNPSDPKARRAWGLRTPIVLKAQETADMLQAAPTFEAQMSVIRRLISILAVAERIPPDDVDTEGKGASLATGIARVVANLPKIEAREERIVRNVAMEEKKLGPRLLALGVALGQLPERARALRVKVEFEGVRLFETQEERAKRYELDLGHNFTTDAKLLAAERGISEDEAAAEIADNAEANGASRPPQQEPQRESDDDAGGILARLVRRTRSGEQREPIQ